MTFIHTLSIEVVLALIRASGMMWIISKPEGAILDASPEFCRWIGYTHEELLRTTWQKISAPDEDLDTDIHAALKGLTAWNPFYVVRKKYIPKNEKPQAGELFVTRFPANGDTIEFCWCWWIPFTSDLSDALEQTKIDADRRMRIIEELKLEVLKLSTITDEEKFIVSGIHMIQKHPKLTIVFTTVVLTLLGVDSVMGVLQKFGIVPVPMPVQMEIKDQRTGDISPVINQVATR